LVRTATGDDSCREVVVIGSSGDGDLVEKIGKLAPSKNPGGGGGERLVVADRRLYGAEECGASVEAARRDCRYR